MLAFIAKNLVVFIPNTLYRAQIINHMFWLKWAKVTQPQEGTIKHQCDNKIDGRPMACLKHNSIFFILEQIINHMFWLKWAKVTQPPEGTIKHQCDDKIDGRSMAYLKHNSVFFILEGWISLIRRSFTSDSNYSQCCNYPASISININNPFISNDHQIIWRNYNAISD